MLQLWIVVHMALKFRVQETHHDRGIQVSKLQIMGIREQ